jgi:hypothetical protein
MTSQGVKIQLPLGGQFSAAVDITRRIVIGQAQGILWSASASSGARPSFLWRLSQRTNMGEEARGGSSWPCGRTGQSQLL